MRLIVFFNSKSEQNSNLPYRVIRRLLFWLRQSSWILLIVHLHQRQTQLAPVLCSCHKRRTVLWSTVLLECLRYQFQHLHRRLPSPQVIVLYFKLLCNITISFNCSLVDAAEIKRSRLSVQLEEIINEVLGRDVNASQTSISTPSPVKWFNTIFLSS